MRPERLRDAFFYLDDVARQWDEALGRMQVLRDRLVTALLAVPAEPAERWTAAHPFGAMLLALVAHDRHHAEQVQLVRIS